MTPAPTPPARHSVPWLQRLKHRLAASPFAGAIRKARSFLARIKGADHPELGLLRQEDALIDLLLVRIVRPDWNCLDIGGHLGSFSRRLRQLAPQGDLFIVEASPGKAAMLTASFPDCTVYPVAVSDKDAQVSFFENLGNPGFSSLANRDNRGVTREIAVPARRLDDLVPAGTRINLIKIDIEGYEYPALRGGEQLLRRTRPVILFEAGAIDDDALDTQMTDALFAMLDTELGYDIYAAFDLYYGRPPITAEMFRSYRKYPFLAFNYFAMPRDLAASAT